VLDGEEGDEPRFSGTERRRVRATRGDPLSSGARNWRAVCEGERESLGRTGRPEETCW